MDQAFFDQLDHWHRQEQFQQIIDAIEAIPAEQRSYELTGLLARAYANTGAAGETDPFEKAVSLLRSTEAEGADDPNWHFRMGYALYYLDRGGGDPPFAQGAQPCPGRPGDAGLLG